MFLANSFAVFTSVRFPAFASQRHVKFALSKLAVVAVSAALAGGASAQSNPQGNPIETSDKPCGIGEIVRDKADANKLLITVPSRFHFKYSGSLVGGNVSIMIAEGYVFRYVQEGEKLSTSNLGKYLPLQDGETIILDQGSLSCAITPNLQSGVLDVRMKMNFLSKPQENNFKLDIPR
jgi:hypothetical protein